MANLKSAQLKGRYRCSKSRVHNLDLWGRKTLVSAIPMASRKVLKAWLRGNIKTSEVEDALNAEYQNIEFLTTAQRESFFKEQVHYLKKYIEAEETARANRTRFYIEPKTKTISLWGTDVDVTPDAVFFDGNRIDAVKYFFKAPDVAHFGSECDKTVSKCLEIMTFWKYANTLSRGENQEIYGGYVYLGGIDEKNPKKAEFGEITPNNQFARGLLVLSKDEKTVDDIYCKEWFRYMAGTSCKDCSSCSEFCPWKNAGMYTEPPKTSKEEKTVSAKAVVLSHSQENAVTFESGMCRVKAGAGAGKTLVLALRVVNLIMNGASPEQLLLITFTVNGAEEMRQRLKAYFEDFGLEPEIVEKIKIVTFNAFAQEVINENWTAVGFTDKPDVVDSIVRKTIILEATDGITLPDVNYKNFESAFGNGGFDLISGKFDEIKAYGIDIYNWESPDKIETSRDLCLNEDWMTAYTKFNEILKSRNLLEYGDQQKYLEQILLEDPYYIENRYKFSHIIVDEFQDTSDKEVELLKKLIDANNFESLFCVGDDAQNIFESLRHTNNKNIINFEDVFGEDTVLLELDDNYRSTPEIIDLANKTNNRRRNKIPSLINAKKASTGENVETHLFTASKREYSYIGGRIADAIKQGIEAGNICFIAKDGQELKDMADELTKRGIESWLLTPESVQKNSRVVAACALSDFIDSSEYTMSAFDYLNTVSHGTLFDKTDSEIELALADFKDEIAKSVSEHGSLGTFFEYLEKLDFSDETFAQFGEKLKKAKSFKEVKEYCNSMMRLGGKEKYRRRGYKGNGVVLTTVHSAKGLEFPIVFMSITKFTGSNIEENRRVLFTGITRAKDKLIITATLSKRRANDLFVKEILEDTNREFVFEDEEEKSAEILEEMEAAKEVERLIKEAKVKAEEARLTMEQTKTEKQKESAEAEEGFF